MRAAAKRLKGGAIVFDLGYAHRDEGNWADGHTAPNARSPKHRRVVGKLIRLHLKVTHWFLFVSWLQRFVEYRQPLRQEPRCIIFFYVASSHNILKVCPLPDTAVVCLSRVACAGYVLNRFTLF